jgi:hypothetical protein
MMTESTSSILNSFAVASVFQADTAMTARLMPAAR